MSIFFKLNFQAQEKADMKITGNMHHNNTGIIQRPLPGRVLSLFSFRKFFSAETTRTL
jgi:hypothetical protein